LLQTLAMGKPGRRLELLDVVGETVRVTRIDAAWSQRELSRRSSVSQAQISRIERGRCRDLQFSILDRLFVALGIRYWLGLEGPRLTRLPSDFVHGRCSAYAGRRLASDGWLVEREVEVGGDRARGWIDILSFHPESGMLLVFEVKSEVLDIGAIERTMNWYEREALLAARRFGWRPERVGSALLILDTRVNLERLQSSAAVFAAGFPGRATELQALISGGTRIEDHRFLAMVDPRSRRANWLRSTRSDGRRTAAPYVDYIDAARKMEPRTAVARRPDPAQPSTPSERASPRRRADRSAPLRRLGHADPAMLDVG
jgi:transcriptional regulator with XRE-family HTH domain